MAEPIVFQVALRRIEDWDNAENGWRCSALRIPGTEVIRVVRGGEPIAFTVDRGMQIIKQERREEPPSDAVVRIEIKRKIVSLYFGAILTVIGSIVTALITTVGGYYTAVAPKGLKLEACHVNLASVADRASRFESDNERLQAQNASLVSITSSGGAPMIVTFNSHSASLR